MLHVPNVMYVRKRYSWVTSLCACCEIKSGFIVANTLSSLVAPPVFDIRKFSAASDKVDIMTFRSY